MPAQRSKHAATEKGIPGRDEGGDLHLGQGYLFLLRHVCSFVQALFNALLFLCSAGRSRSECTKLGSESLDVGERRAHQLLIAALKANRPVLEHDEIYI